MQRKRDTERRDEEEVCVKKGIGGQQTDLVQTTHTNIRNQQQFWRLGQCSGEKAETKTTEYLAILPSCFFSVCPSFFFSFINGLTQHTITLFRKSLITMLYTCPTLWWYLAQTAFVSRKKEQTHTHTNSHKGTWRTHTFLQGHLLRGCVSVCTFIRECVWQQLCVQTVACMGLNCGCVCVCLRPTEAHLMETQFYCVSNRQSDKQFASFSGAELGCSWWWSGASM